MNKNIVLSDPKIRLAGEGDVPRIRELMDLSVQNLTVREWFVDDDEDEIRKLISEEGYTLLYEETDPQGEKVTAGYLQIKHPLLTDKNLGRYLHFTDEELIRTGHIESVSVDPVYRGYHIFGILLKEALVLEKEIYHMQHSMSTVHPDNIYSRRNLESAGFSGVLTQQMYRGWMHRLL